MALSPSIQSAVDQIRRNKSLTQSLQAERDLWKKKAQDLQSQLDDLASKDEMSDEDKDAIQKATAELDEMNDELEGAAHENVTQGSDDGQSAQNPAVVPPYGADGHPTEAPTSGDVATLNGPANNPAGGTAPLMPTMAFDPDPTTARGIRGDGQPNQPKAVETPGGFVVAGGGTTARAPGSFPDSPSSSVVTPADPDAKAPANNADLIKSGLGDSSQNALVDGDGTPVADIAARQAVGVGSYAGTASGAPKTDEDAADAPANQRPVIKPVAETDAERTAKSDQANPEGSRVSDADKDASTDAIPPARGGPNG